MREHTLLQDDEFESLSTSRLLEILDKSLLLERGRALFELARRSDEDKILLEKIVNDISNPKNVNTKTFGVVSLSFLGMAGLMEANTDATKSAAKKLLEAWPESSRSDLIYFLQSSSLIHDLLD
jgi:hypothetical protein